MEISKNTHIENYLKNYYCDNKNSTPFAVLLKGSWGSGKTHFIKKYISNLENEEKKKFLHISLYGLSKTSEINEKIIPNLLKGYAKSKKSCFNWNWNKKMENISNFSFTILNNLLNKLPFDKGDIINILGSFTDTIIIFDDLERCCIPMAELMGYLTHLVEFQDQKIILVADEEKILSDGKKKTEYTEKKEKLVGQEFKIESSPEEAIIDFVQETSDPALKQYSEKINTILMKVFVQSGYNNLRLINQAFSAFEYFFKNLNIQALLGSSEHPNDELGNILCEFVMVYIEYKSGRLSPEVFNQYFKDPNKTDSKSCMKKYDYYRFYGCQYFEVDILKKILMGESLSDYETIEIKRKISVQLSESEKTWQKLWYYSNHSDEEFFENLKDVQQKWDTKEYTDFFIILHVFGMFLHFSKESLFKKDKGSILQEAKDYVEILIQNNTFPSDLHRKDTHFFGGWKGDYYSLGYRGKEEPEWSTFLNFVEEKAQQLVDIDIKNEVKNQIIPILQNGGAGHDLQMLMNNNFLGGKIAYFHLLDPYEIKNIFIKNDTFFILVTMRKVFSNRYQRYQEITDVKKEISFLEEFKNVLEAEVKDREETFGSKTPKTIALRSFIADDLDPSILILSNS